MEYLVPVFVRLMLGFSRLLAVNNMNFSLCFVFKIDTYKNLFLLLRIYFVLFFGHVSIDNNVPSP